MLCIVIEKHVFNKDSYVIPYYLHLSVFLLPHSHVNIPFDRFWWLFTCQFLHMDNRKWVLAIRPDGPGGRSPADRTCKGDAPKCPRAEKESGLFTLAVLPGVMLHRWRRRSRLCGRSSWPRRRMPPTSGGNWVWVPSVTSNRTCLRAGTTCRAQPRECR